MWARWSSCSVSSTLSLGDDKDVFWLSTQWQNTIYLYIYYYINFAYISARKIHGFVSEDITDSVENNELTAEGNGQAIGDGDV